MKLNGFESAFTPDRPVPQGQPPIFHATIQDAEVGEFLSSYGSRFFNNGLYRTMNSEIFLLAQGFVADAFPNFAGQVTTFSYDWLGRIFAVDSRHHVAGYPGVFFFEPGTGEAFETPCNLRSLHENELPEFGDETLALEFYGQWLASGGPMPRLDECVGYKKPLFLGGTDTVQKLELCNLDVYWTLSAQIISQVRGLPPGTPIKSITISD